MKRYVKSNSNLNYDKAEFCSGLEYCIKVAVNNYCQNTIGRGIYPPEEKEINKLLYSTDISDKIYEIIEKRG